MWHEPRATGDLSAHEYPIRIIGTDGILPHIEYSCHHYINSCNMHQNGTTVLCSQCGMNPEPVSGPETLPHTNILFRPSELTGYCLIFNIHANIE
jgi:hypothetical protein